METITLLEMMKYQAKPVEARQVTIDNIMDISNWIGGNLRIDSESCVLGYVDGSGEYNTSTDYGDWIVKEFGEFYTYSDENFKKKYEVLNEKTNSTKPVGKPNRTKRATPTKRRPNAKRARKKDL